MGFNLNINWKLITNCSICDHYGFVQEHEHLSDGIRRYHTCYYGCGDKRNIATLENSMCEYCRDNKADEVYKDDKITGFYCSRCKLELMEIKKFQ